jgi:type II secretory pathway component PulK
MRHERGAILIVVLIALAMMAILGGSLWRSSTLRILAAHDFRRVEEDARKERDARGGEHVGENATIGDGAAGASSN